MAGAAREWVTIPVPGKESSRWECDVTFLASPWTCIFGAGCQGVLTEPAPELGHGCCSYGAWFTGKADLKRVERVAKDLTDGEWQFRSVGLAKGIAAKVGKEGRRTRLVDDACIFLNRPGFPAGPGCALHQHAIRTGRHFVETKPDVCWQLPLRARDREEEDGSTTHVLSEFSRQGWGEGGEEFAWWCTEASEAFVGAEPVYRSQERELREMMGDAPYDALAAYLDARGAAGPPPLPHPAARPVALGSTRRRQADLT